VAATEPISWRPRYGQALRKPGCSGGPRTQGGRRSDLSRRGG